MPTPLRLNASPLEGWVDPEVLFRDLERRESDIFWLDAGPGADRGWSLIGTGRPVDAAEPAAVRLDTADGFISPEPSTPPFLGGWVGWLDYESGAARAGALVAASAQGSAWLAATSAIAFDHAARRMWVLEHPSAAHTLAALVGTLGHGTGLSARDIAAPSSASASPRHSPQEYLDLIEHCRSQIRAGRAYQLCLTTRFTVAGEHDAVDVYSRLRTATPAHHGGFVRIGGRTLLSASPEQFLHVGSGRVRTRPIKGTRPRDPDPAVDEALAAELRESAKERAENVMIVDLMRNDLSRVCVPGSIRVDSLWEVESYPAVHQLVSAVSGIPTPGTTVGDLWDSTFPAGSMTGAPKLSAMTILESMERAPRGVYSGCFGFVGIDGRVDLAMVIRSVVLEPGTAFVGAGGGITWGSVASAEVAEVATKARAPLAALGAVLPSAWDLR